MGVDLGSAVGVADEVGTLVAVVQVVGVVMADGEVVSVALGVERMEWFADRERGSQPGVSWTPFLSLLVPFVKILPRRVVAETTV